MKIEDHTGIPSSEIYPLFYHAPISYWQSLLRSKSEVGIPLSVTIPKKSYANRCIIATANGLQTLSIPLLGGRGTRDHYHEIKISYAEPWVAKHKNALHTAYARSSYYEFFIDRYHAVYDQRVDMLSELNFALMEISYAILTPKNTPHCFRLDHSIEYRNDHYFRYIPNQFQSTTPYPQVFRNKFDFQPDLSILDWIFNMGKSPLI